MKKIAILYLGNYYYDSRLINMATSLSNNNYMVDVFCIQSQQDSSFSPGLKNVYILPISLKYNGILKYIEFFFKGRKKLNGKKYYCIIAGDVYSLASACYIRYKARLIYDCREIYSELAAHVNQPFYQLLITKYEKYFIKFYSNVLVTAQTDAALLKNKFAKYKHLKWHLLYNFPKYPEDLEIINLHKTYNIPKNHTIICYQGVIQKGRGIGALFKVLQKNNQLWACIVGDGEAKCYYKKLANNYSINNHVLFIGHIPYIKLLEYTAACDIGWAVIQEKGISNKFALPNKLFEYGLANIPVIASKLPNLIEIITKYKLGVLVDSQDIDEQLGAINTLKQIGLLSQYNKIIKDNFLWDVQDKKFIRIIKDS